MSREVRRVSANWEHPKKEDGRYRPLWDGDFSQDLKEWEEAKSLFVQGKYKEYTGEIKNLSECSYRSESDAQDEWIGRKPDQNDYMPEWSEEEKTHIQMYETTSEGTPISPVMNCPNKLAQWLADNNASACGRATATYDQWLSTIERGFAVSALYTPQTGFVSGVEGLSNESN